MFTDSIGRLKRSSSIIRNINMCLGKDEDKDSMYIITQSVMYCMQYVWAQVTGASEKHALNAVTLNALHALGKYLIHSLRVPTLDN